MRYEIRRGTESEKIYILRDNDECEESMWHQTISSLVSSAPYMHKRRTKLKTELIFEFDSFDELRENNPEWFI